MWRRKLPTFPRRPTLLAVVLIAGCGRDFDDIATAESVTLYSLDGFGAGEFDYEKHPPPGGTLHGFGVLGSTTIEEADGRRVAAALNRGLQDSEAAACFLPRHAVRVESDGSQTDFVICFECLQYSVYVDGKRTDHGLIDETPEPVLDEILKKAGVPLAPKAFSKEWQAEEEARWRAAKASEGDRKPEDSKVPD